MSFGRNANIWNCRTPEAEFTDEAIRALQGEQWAAPLLRKIKQSGGVLSAPLPLLLEVRIAYAFHQNGLRPEYEFATGSGAKSVDFRVQASPDWLIEVVSLTESDAVREATQQDGLFSSLALNSLSEDPRHSEEGEILRAMEHIADKAEKFPDPSSAAFHVILSDMRGYLLGMGDRGDYREIAYGTNTARPEQAHSWNGRPIFGLFDSANTRDSARMVQDRIHYLGFLTEKQYCKGEIENETCYIANPKFFETKQDAKASFPLKRTRAASVS
jgi:hypothetical protein